MSNTTLWPSEAICLNPTSTDAASLATTLYRRTCRSDFIEPGFCVLNVGSGFDSVSFRRLMVELLREMGVIHCRQSGRDLIVTSAARFDQQTSTKPHLDGGPEESLLMLGYEPSAILSELEISDYSRCAFELGMTPKEFLGKHNPMFAAGYEMLRPYTTRIPCFSNGEYQIICINNSSAPYSGDPPSWQGVLHTARILTPDDSERRVVDSIMLASGEHDRGHLEEQLEEFVTTTIVRRRGYDKEHLEDDR